MGKGGKKRRPSSDESGVSEIGSDDDAATVEPDEPAQPDPPPPEPEAPKAAEVIEMAEVKVAINMFARTKRGEGALITAFMVTTKANEGIVKRTMSEWNTIYTKWLKAPR